MISKQQREELSALHAAATYDEWRADDTYVYMPTGESKLTIAYVSYPIAAKLIVVMQNALPGLLGDLDEKDAEIERMRARCEALERALNYPSCSNPECHWYTPCDTCKTDSEFCDHLCNDEGETELDMSESCPFWQFDQARFEGGEES